MTHESRRWYVRRESGEILGPMGSRELHDLGQRGAIGLSDRVRLETDGQWLPPARIKGLPVASSPGSRTQIAPTGTPAQGKEASPVCAEPAARPRKQPLLFAIAGGALFGGLVIGGVAYLLSPSPPPIEAHRADATEIALENARIKERHDRTCAALVTINSMRNRVGGSQGNPYSLISEFELKSIMEAIYGGALTEVCAYAGGGGIGMGPILYTLENSREVADRVGLDLATNLELQVYASVLMQHLGLSCTDYAPAMAIRAMNRYGIARAVGQNLNIAEAMLAEYYVMRANFTRKSDNTRWARIPGDAEKDAVIEQLLEFFKRPQPQQ